MKRKPGSIKSSIQRCSQPECVETQIMDLRETNLYAVPTQLKLINVMCLILDNNNIKETIISSNFVYLNTLSLKNNNMKKLSFKMEVKNTYQQFNLRTLNLQSNILQFVDATSFNNLQSFNCSNNSLSTVILPPSLINIDCSHNKFTNIGHSLLGNRSFPSLKQLRIHNNQLYDIKLCLSHQENQCPNLQTLDAHDNKITTIQALPFTLKHLHISNNQIIFDRSCVNELLRIHKLVLLDIRDNPIDMDCYQFIINKLPSLHTLINETNNSIKQESPYKLFVEEEYKEKQWAFTLGDCNEQSDQEIIDIEYNNLCLHNNQTKKQPFSQNNNILNTTTTKYQMKVKSEQPLRYNNHYCHFMNTLLQYSFIPVKPIKHHQQQKIQSFRIDPPQKNINNQYSLLNQMFKSRGGVHYVRKIVNWSKTRLPPQNPKNTHQIMFINKDFTKTEFQNLCDGQFEILYNITPKIKNLLGWQPSSFTCHHVLLRLKINCQRSERDWGCMYLVESAHL